MSKIENHPFQNNKYNPKGGLVLEKGYNLNFTPDFSKKSTEEDKEKKKIESCIDIIKINSFDFSHDEMIVIKKLISTLENKI
jgi:hypothetical protein